MYFTFLFFFHFVLLCSLFFCFNFRVLLPLKQTRKVLFSFKTTNHLTAVWMHMLFFEFFFFVTVIPEFYSLFPAHSGSQMIFGIRHRFGQENHVFFELLWNFNFVDCVVDLCLVRLNGHLSSFSPLPHPRGFF